MHLRALPLALPLTLAAIFIPVVTPGLQGRQTSANQPNPPVITEPSRDGQIVSPASVHMETAPFVSSVPGDTHAATDWEIRLMSTQERVWVSRAVVGETLVHTHFGDGTFEGTHEGRRDLLSNTDYLLRVRHEGSLGGPSDWTIRRFRTDVQIPGEPGRRFRVNQPGFQIDVVATDFRLPVNIAFVPNPQPDPSAPLYYVTELYGTIKVVARDGHIRTYAGGDPVSLGGELGRSLLNFNPTGAFPGSGEQGLTGIVVDRVTGDVFASLVYSIVDSVNPPITPEPPHYGRVLRFESDDGGLTAARRRVIFDTACTLTWMPGQMGCGEEQGQSHQISNLTIGPDGKLYVHNGEGFTAARAQNLNSFGGKILRMELDGLPVEDNPFYDGSIDPRTGRPAARNFVYALGLRNPFGGAWRAADGKHYVVENGPETNDRLTQTVRGRNYTWGTGGVGTAAQMTAFAVYNWAPPTAPVNAAFIQRDTFGGSEFPEARMDHLFVSESGPTYGAGPQINGKRITEFVLNDEGDLVSGPRRLIEFVGTGRASVAALAAGPDGLYFSDLYRDDGVGGPIARGANIYRIRTTTAPLSPVLQVTDTCVDQIDLAWTGTADSRYEIERSIDARSFTRIATVDAPATRYSDRGLSFGRYFYRVRAFNISGEPTLSNIVGSTIGPITVDFSDGFVTPDDLVVNGGTRFEMDVAKLTNGGMSEAGTLFTMGRVGIRRFTTAFTFRIYPGTPTMADGMTFIIQGVGPAALGPSGGGLAYGPDQPVARLGIRDSVAVKFDIFNNAGEGFNSTGLFSGGRSPTVPQPGSGDVLISLDGTGIDLRSQHVFRTDMSYDGTTLQVTITDLETMLAAVQSYTVDIPGLVGADTAHVGFGGGTGGFTAVQEVRSWTFVEQDETLPPRAPSRLQVTNVRPFDQTRSDISIAWRCHNAYTATGFAIERSTDGLTFVEIATVGPSVTSYIDERLVQGTYYYRVRSLSPSGSSRFSNVDSVLIGGGEGLTVLDYSGGFSDQTRLTPNGSARFEMDVARLTNGGPNQAGSFFFSNRIAVASFFTTFTFRIYPGSPTIADGMTFVIQGENPMALGGLGGGLGYGSDQPGPSRGIQNSLAVKFDVFNNAGEGFNSTGLFTGGRSPTVADPESGDVLVRLDGTGIDLRSQHLFQVDMTYDGTMLVVTITDLETMASATQMYTVDIPAAVASNVAYVGFSGGTGGLTAIQDVMTWALVSQKSR